MHEMTTRITIRKPDDWHLHVRDGAMLKAVLPFTAKHFGRAILMPNLVPPVVTTKDAVAYRERVTAALPAGSTFEPLMTCYLTDHTDAEEIARGPEAVAHVETPAGVGGVAPVPTAHLRSAQFAALGRIRHDQHQFPTIGADKNIGSHHEK